MGRFPDDNFRYGGDAKQSRAGLLSAQDPTQRRERPNSSHCNPALVYHSHFLINAESCYAIIRCSERNGRCIRPQRQKCQNQQAGQGVLNAANTNATSRDGDCDETEIVKPDLSERSQTKLRRRPRVTCCRPSPPAAILCLVCGNCSSYDAKASGGAHSSSGGLRDPIPIAMQL